MLIERTSQLTGIHRVLDLPVTTEQLLAYERGALLQVAFPNLCSSDREFIKSGITGEEWLSIFAEDEEEELD
jgi:hypothetical protein